MARDSLLWQLSHPKSPHNVYLLGTIHVYFRGVEAVVDRIGRFCQDQGVVIVATEIGDISYAAQNTSKVESDGEHHIQDASEQRLSEKSMPVLNLQDDLTPARRLHYAKYLRRTSGQELMSLDGQNPILASSALMMPPEAARRSGLDECIVAMAINSGYAHYGLESMSEQMGYLADLPRNVQVQVMKNYLRSMDVSGRQLSKMLASYRAQHIHHLYRLGRSQMGTLRRKLLIVRNDLMMQRLEDLATPGEGPLFVAVGAAHLSGGKGLLHLARQSGYKLRPLSYALGNVLSLRDEVHS